MDSNPIIDLILGHPQLSQILHDRATLPAQSIWLPNFSSAIIIIIIKTFLQSQRSRCPNPRHGGCVSTSTIAVAEVELIRLG